MRAGCSRCSLLEAELAALRATNEQLKAELEELHALSILQQGDIERFREAQRGVLQPNAREHVPASAMQLAFAEIVKTFGEAANDATSTEQTLAEAAVEANDESGATTPEPKGRANKNKRGAGRRGHGRRGLDTQSLPIVNEVIDPEEVVRAGGVGYVKIGEETADRVAHRPASWIVLRVTLTKWKKVNAETTTIVRAETPPNLWPRSMADASAVAHIILAKYDMSLPLHRQERASTRLGFYLPRSTQCGWLSEAHGYLHHIVDAMMKDACRTAHCIATDATSAPIRALRECRSWHLFVFIADRDHVVFRAVAEHTSATIAALLHGFKGTLLSDASSIYDALGKAGILLAYCWAHVRRYFWRARDTDKARAEQALAILAKLWDVEREVADISMPERTTERARRAEKVLVLFDQWIEGVRPSVEPRTPLAAALTYYDNQRVGLRHFLGDGRLRVDNNPCEAQLRNLVLGRRNWTFFENPNGLRWYAVFRSLIASCALHGLEPGRYLEQVLRLAPHWPHRRALELAPKYWAATMAALTPEQRAIIRQPWDRGAVLMTPSADAAAAA